MTTSANTSTSRRADGIATRPSAPQRGRIKVRISASSTARLAVGTQWRVIAPSLETLWEDPQAVTLEEIDCATTGGDA